MYYQKFIDFLKNHNLYDEKVFKYWQENSTYFDYRDEDSRIFMGCFYQYENGYLRKIGLFIPFIDDDKTLLINIHEYIHLLLLYYKIGTKHKIGNDKEVLPLFFERIFVEENNTKELNKYYQYLNQIINEENKEEYILGLKLSDSIKEKYNNDNIFKLDKKVKKLIKKNSYI